MSVGSAVLHCISSFSYSSSYKVKILVTLSKDKTVFFLHIKRWVSIRHAWHYSRKLGLSTANCSAVTKGSRYWQIHSPRHTAPDPGSYSQIDQLLLYDNLSVLLSAFGLCMYWKTWEIRDKLLMCETSDFMYLTPQRNVSTPCCNNCCSYKTDVKQHLFVTPCINWTLIWVYPLTQTHCPPHMTKRLRQKELTCDTEHLLQQLGSPNKT